MIDTFNATRETKLFTTCIKISFIRNHIDFRYAIYFPQFFSFPRHFMTSILNGFAQLWAQTFRHILWIFIIRELLDTFTPADCFSCLFMLDAICIQIFLFCFHLFVNFGVIFESFKKLITINQCEITNYQLNTDIVDSTLIKINQGLYIRCNIATKLYYMLNEFVIWSENNSANCKIESNWNEGFEEANKLFWKSIIWCRW